MYTRRRLVGCQAAIASKLGSHIGSVYIGRSQAGCKAALANKRSVARSLMRSPFRKLNLVANVVLA